MQKKPNLSCKISVVCRNLILNQITLVLFKFIMNTILNRNKLLFLLA